jgi:hypothetical protein
MTTPDYSYHGHSPSCPCWDCREAREADLLLTPAEIDALDAWDYNNILDAVERTEGDAP